MKYFFVNLILNTFFILPNWFLKVINFPKREHIRDSYLDRQSAAFLKLIDVFGYKVDTENFSKIERLNSNLAKLEISINKKTLKKFATKNIYLNHEDNVFLKEYIPAEVKSNRAILYFHGGGYVLGSVDTHHNFVSQISTELGVKIYSLEYRLAPENKFPDALDDANEAYKWLTINGFSHKQIILCGDSAGAHLAASLVNHLDISKKDLPNSQILIYPMISPTLNFESMELFKENYLLTKGAMRWFWDQLKDEENNDFDPRFNLLKQKNVTEFNTKTLVFTAGFDPLSDEGIEYAKHLKGQGNEVSHIQYQNLFHGFVTVTKLREANKATLDIINEIGKKL